MRLGLTNASYQYLFGGDGEMFVDRTSGKYDWRGLPRPYFTQTPPMIHTDSVELWQVERARQLGVPVVHCPIMDWSEDNVARISAALDENGQELVPAIFADLVVRGEQLEKEIENAIDLIERYARLGVQLSKFCLVPMIYNRFRKDPPLREQLDRMIAGLPAIVEAAERNGIVLAFENHLDYRASEVVEIIEAIDSPNLQFLFDTGNPFSVCEDPIEAAEVAAPYTVLAHIKDVVVMPWTPASLGYFACMYACPLGEGNVEIEKIVQLLAERSPVGDALTLAIEVTPMPPSTDEDLWVEKGIEWMREHLASHLDESAPATAGGATA
jgi:sugar phosphate isomerase/epimerase